MTSSSLNERNFSLKRLEKLLELPNVMWRHDVDFSLESALKMACFEAERGISAHYFLFFDDFCPFYSADDATSLARELVNLGHRFGQHIDERYYPSFEHFRGRKSFHCPTERVLWREFPHFQSMYDPIWQGRYFADSNGHFRYGDPEDWSDHRAIRQVSLHAEWWFDPGWISRVDDQLYEDFFYEKKQFYADMFPRGFSETSGIGSTTLLDLKFGEIFDAGLEYYGEFYTNLEYGWKLLHEGAKLDGKLGKVSVVARYENAVQLKWRSF